MRALLALVSSSVMVLAAGTTCAASAAVAAQRAPRTLIYREVDGRALRAHVFSPVAPARGKPVNAILLFHGGGWSAGQPEWTFDAARRFADWGLVAIAVEYRLSLGDVTPIESIDDVCAAFRWTREHARDLGISGRVAGYGVSAGGHLVAAAAALGCPGANAGPDALLLWSPALDVAADRWFQGRLQDRARPADLSPVEHVGASTPPTCIVHGARDALTPLSGAQRYCDRLARAGGTCELNVHEGVGHLLTRNLANQESDFDPDPGARAAGIAQHLRFLRRLGFVADSASGRSRRP